MALASRYNRINVGTRRQGAGGIKGLPELRNRLNGSYDRLRTLIRELLDETIIRWYEGVMHRVPFDVLRSAGDPHVHLRESIEYIVEEIGDVLYAAIGSNEPQASYTEFGTRRIAQGAVLALGDSAEITDAQAIHSWPAKDARGGGPEQMPWLRPSWMEIEPWFREQLGYCMIAALSGGSRA